MNSQTLLKSICNRSIAALVISLGLLSAASDSANAQMMERRGMGGMDGGRDRGGMRGGDVGVGVGIGVGTAIIQQGIQSRPTADEPVTVRSKKTTKTKSGRKTARPRPEPEDVKPNVSTEPKQPPVAAGFSFPGKPDNIAHDPDRKGGALGTTSDHKPVLIMKDTRLYKRNYYAEPDGNKNWFYYDERVRKTDDSMRTMTEIPSCGEYSDNCQMISWNPFKPEPYGPPLRAQRCFVDIKPGPPKTVQCTNRGGSNNCSGSCELTVDDGDFGSTWFSRKQPRLWSNGETYTCSCE